MRQNPTISGSPHPAPHREKAPIPALAFAVSGAPIAWALHLLINYSIAGQHCLGAAASEDSLIDATVFLTPIFIVDVVTFAIAASAGYVAYNLWRRTKDEKIGEAQRLVDAGEGRTRFMAMCGILASVLFGFAISVDALGSIVGPPC